MNTSDIMEPIEIRLIRHGMTAGNLEKRYIGVTDEPLCEEGLRQLRPFSDAPLIRQVFVSPMIRCVQTAAVCFPQAEQIPIPDLAEMDFGIFENRRFSGDLEFSPEYRKWLDSLCEDPVPEGEDKKAFEERSVRGFLQALARREQDCGPAVFVVHGGTVMSVLSRFARPRREYYEWNPANGHGFSGRWDGQYITEIKEI